MRPSFQDGHVVQIGASTKGDGFASVSIIGPDGKLLARRDLPRNAPLPPDVMAVMPQEEQAASSDDGRKRLGESGLLFHGTLRPDSIGHCIRELARACHRLGYDVGLEIVSQDGSAEQSWARTSVRHLTTARPRLPVVRVGWACCADHAHYPGAPRVIFDIRDGWRYTQPERIASEIDTCDLVCVPGEYGKSCFDGLVKPPVENVPLGVDTNVYQPWPADRQLYERAQWHGEPPGEGTWVVLVAGALQPRKGLSVAVDAFRRAFAGQNAALLVKNMTTPWTDGRKPTSEWMYEHALDLRYGVIDETLSEWQFARLLATVDCYLAPHHAEGFGLIPLQAMACGTPVVTTDFDGPTQYADDSNAYLVAPAQVVGVRPWLPKGWAPAQADVAWAELDRAAFADALLQVKADPGCKREAALATAREWTWENAARRLVAAIERHCAPLRRRDTPVPIASGENPTLTIMAPVHNGAAHIERFVTTARQTQWPGDIEVLLLDDASTDGSRAIAEATGARVFSSDAWIGEWAQRDIGFRRARGAYIYSGDIDLEFSDPEWALRMKEAVDAEQGRIVAHPLLLDSDGAVWSAGGCYRRIGDRDEPWLYMGDDPRALAPQSEIAHAPGAGWFVRAAEVVPRIEWIGGYFPTYYADTDMALWLRTQGIGFREVAASRIVHHHGSFTASGVTNDIYTRNGDEFADWWRDVVDHDVAVARIEGAMA